jgi:hypothetical protein
MKSPIKSILIAPCGMNCGICLAYLREKNRCAGCNTDDMDKSAYCSRCIIKNCELLKKSGTKFCFKCEKFPCKRLKQLDKRYRTKYNMSMLENLEYIKNHGVRKFVKNEKTRWTCMDCGGTICVHRGFCYSCGKKLDL